MAAVTFAACNKNTKEEGTARMQVSLTDAPGDFEGVYINVQDVMINPTGDEKSGWTPLSNVRRGTYNLLDLVNGKDTLLCDAEIPSGRLEQIRLVLGPDCYVKTDGATIKLETPGALQSGLKLNIHQQVSAGAVYQLLLDFDVAKSIVLSGNGKYHLKPVIRTVLQPQTGVRGAVAIDSVQTAVLAIQGADTLASSFTWKGNYLIRGLNPGTYDLHYLPVNHPDMKAVKTGIEVKTGMITTVDTVQFSR